MCSLYFVDIDLKKESKKICFDNFPQVIKEKIENTKNEKLKTERFLVYEALINILLKEVSKEKIEKDFDFDVNGKPYLKNSDIFFSVSHTQDMALIGVSKNKIGVDIEKINDAKIESISKIVSKYAFGKSANKHNDIDNVNFCYDFCIKKDLQPKKVDFQELNEMKKENPYLLWTRIESILKCDGCGFKNVSSIDEFSDLQRTQSFEVEKEKERYIFSVSLEK